MSESEPSIRIVMPAWNAERTIARAIKSALDQAGVVVEVIVVDDCSTDRTQAVVQALNDPRIHYQRAPRNGGPAAARNVGFDAARAPLVAVLDADDYMLPGRLASLRQIAVEQEADIVADNLIVLRDDLGTQELFFDVANASDLEEITLERYLRENTVFHSKRTLGYLKPLFRLRFLRDKNIRYDETLRVSEDFALVAEALAAGARFHYASQALYVYTISRSGSASNRLNAGSVKTMMAADDAFMRAHSPRLTAEELTAARFRRRTLDQAYAFLIAIQALKERQFWRAGRALIGEPSSIGLFRMPIRAKLRGLTSTLSARGRRRALRERPET